MDEAVNAFEEMRRATIALLEQDETQTRQKKMSYDQHLRTILKFSFSWIKSRLNHASFSKADVLVFYAPNRFDKIDSETEQDFTNRILRSNRNSNLLNLLEINDKSIETIAVLPAFSEVSRHKNKATIFDFLFGLLGSKQMLKIGLAGAFAIMRRQSATRAVKSAIISQLKYSFTDRPQTLIFLTSNSTLCEYIRLAACMTHKNHVVEVLHGIASNGMELFYNFIEMNAKSKITYVNLIAGLPQFSSIERHLMSDSDGEIAVNCHLWSKIDETRTLEIGKLDSCILIVGGTSQDENYYRSSYFGSELDLISAVSRFDSKLDIYYCPHPANNPNDEVMLDKLSLNSVMLAPLSTIQMLFTARVAIGAYSTSLFEAALLGKPVLLLPVKEGLLMDKLKDLAVCMDADTSIRQQVNRFLSAEVVDDPSPDGLVDLNFKANSKLGIKLSQGM